MGLYKAIRETWQNNRDELEQQMTLQWRGEPATIRIFRPTRLDRARSLGYKAKQGFVLIRQRVDAGGRQRPKITGGRRTKHNRRYKVLDMNYQGVAERRACENYPNCEVMSSYLVGSDSKHKWYEVILVDRAHPQILADKNAKGVATQLGRAQRGLTSANRKSRGLRNKGKGTEGKRESGSAQRKRRLAGRRKTAE
jgi:large subunit ribosomal protein L15e